MSRSNKVSSVLVVALLIGIPWLVSTGADDAKPKPSFQAAEQAAETPPKTAIGGAIVTSPRAAPKPRHLSEARIRWALQSPTDVEFIETPLEEAINFLKEQHNISIVLDRQKIADEGVATDTPVTLQLSGIRLESVLHLILEKYKLDWIIQDEVLKITTQSHAAKALETHVYKVRHLLDAGHDEDNLIDTINATVLPNSWDWVGGPGSIMMANETLIVRQTQHVHSEIERLLSDLQNAADEQAEKQPAGDAVSLKVYHPQENAAEELAKSLPDLIEPKSWEKSGGPGVVRAVTGVLLVKQTSAVHSQIRRVLREFPSPFPSPGGMSGSAAQPQKSAATATTEPGKLSSPVGTTVPAGGAAPKSQ